MTSHLIDYALFYTRVERALGDVDIGKRDIGINFPDALDKVIFQLVGLAEPMEEEANILFGSAAINYPQYFGPHADTLIRVKLIQLGYLTKNDDLP